MVSKVTFVGFRGEIAPL